MKSSRSLTAALAGLTMLFAASCGKEDTPSGTITDVPREEGVTVEFVIGNGSGETKATSFSDSDEKNVNRWALFIFEDGTLVTYGESAGPGSIAKTLSVGSYDVYAVVNYRTSGSGAFNPSAVTSVSGLTGTVVYLDGVSAADIPMFGYVAGVSVTPEGGTKKIPVERLVTRLGIRKITLNLERATDAAKTFTLRNVYVSNAYGRTRMGSDYSSSEISDTRSWWINSMGIWDATGNSAALLGDRGINEVLVNGSSHNTPHYFYSFPNAVDTDTHDEPWCKRRTRIIIEASLGGVTYYYLVNLPETYRNNTYTVANATITKPGSLDPEKPTDGAVDVVFSTSTDEWDVVSVSENS